MVHYDRVVFPDELRSVSPGLRHLLGRMLDKNPKSRISIEYEVYYSQKGFIDVLLVKF